MRKSKVMSLFLITALVAGSVTVAPELGEAKTGNELKKEREKKQKKSKRGEKKDSNNHSVDKATINLERLAKNLKARGIIDEDAEGEKLQAALDDYLANKKVPQGNDTSTTFGAKMRMSQEVAQEEAVAKVAEYSDGKKRSKDDPFTDNIVVSLIEFPDLPRNQIEKQSDSIWLSDFNEEHYEKMLFSPSEYTLPDGVEMTTMRQLFEEQSGGTWSVDGVVTPWQVAKKSFSYYGENYKGDDSNPRELVIETLEQVGKLIEGKEDLYDQRDPYDMDGDGDLNEPDGYLDNLMVVHAGIGEETGENDDAIWSHRWTLEEPVEIPGTSLLAYDYMIQPEDGASGVFSHEYGHNLGLPDLYDTSSNDNNYDSPVGAWSLMSSGSHTGYVFQTQPTGFDPWSKMVLQELYGGNWVDPKVINFRDTKKARQFELNHAVDKDAYGKLLKINMPDVEVEPGTKPIGKKSYYSDMGNSITTSMISKEIDLTNANSATLTFDSWRDIEEGYDFLYLDVIDVEADEVEELSTWSDVTDEWVEEEFDLSDYAGKKLVLEFTYYTDVAVAHEGVYLDNIVVTADGQEIFKDDVERDSLFETDGFSVFDGTGKEYPAFYLVELRSHKGVDAGLKYFRRGDTYFTYDPGMVIWYYDGGYGRNEDNNTSNHPGYGMLGVVDSHQKVAYWNGNEDLPADSRYQVRDAAFSPKKTRSLSLNYIFGTLTGRSEKGVTLFRDKDDFTMPGLPEVGKVLPEVGLMIELIEVDDDFRNGVIEVSRKRSK
ncbi:immune inhibitor A domain-containing protein [Brevibacillus daliensis]|uniref:immune inhibitor A domain-containing protein n=1 Tax=Brevibacillus daliensis TaxID=2892995 RepID=UPI001E51FFFB|nr:immune inhibitor A domain-containing protein [Brevibacillus daliensis]